MSVGHNSSAFEAFNTHLFVALCYTGSHLRNTILLNSSSSDHMNTHSDICLHEGPEPTGALYLHNMQLYHSMLWDLRWVGRCHLCHRVDLLVCVATHVMSRHSLLQSQPHDTSCPISSYQQVICHLQQF